MQIDFIMMEASDNEEGAESGDNSEMETPVDSDPISSVRNCDCTAVDTGDLNGERCTSCSNGQQSQTTPLSSLITSAGATENCNEMDQVVVDEAAHEDLPDVAEIDIGLVAEDEKSSDQNDVGIDDIEVKMPAPETSENHESEGSASSGGGNLMKGLSLPDCFSFPQQMHQWEIGGKVRRYANPQRFANMVGSSVSLVRRMQLYNRLDGHTGCVNALHFNDSGRLKFSALYTHYGK